MKDDNTYYPDSYLWEAILFGLQEHNEKNKKLNYVINNLKELKHVSNDELEPIANWINKTDENENFFNAIFRVGRKYGFKTEEKK